MRWKSKMGLRATYRNLLSVFVMAGHTRCAEALCEVIKMKCESTIITYNIIIIDMTLDPVPTASSKKTVCS